MKQLDQKAVWLFFISYVSRWIFFVIFLSFFLGSFFQNVNSLAPNDGLSLNFLNWLWLAIPILLVVCFIWAKLSYHFYRYDLTDLGFRKEYGVIYKKYVTIPYDRIQNVDIYRGILARILGLSDLNIQTAGASVSMGRYGAMGGGAEGRLPAISKQVAEQLRDELVRRTRESKHGQGL